MTVAGIYHFGSGLGNMLHRYVGTKIIAIKQGKKHTMVAPELFKGKDFLKLEIEPNDIKYTIEYPSGKVIPESMEGVIDGEFQKEEDFIEYLDIIRKWLSPPLSGGAENPSGGQKCVINFRGGEYVGVRDLFLPQEYWDRAIEKMGDMEYEVHTDDPVTARIFFPDYEIISDMEKNWKAIRYAENLILSNSSFAILPALLSEAKTIIAPMYWSGYSTGVWPKEKNQYKRFTYI